jgi:hypothetical protein
VGLVVEVEEHGVVTRYSVARLRQKSGACSASGIGMIPVASCSPGAAHCSSRIT